MAAAILFQCSHDFVIAKYRAISKRHRNKPTVLFLRPVDERACQNQDGFAQGSLEKWNSMEQLYNICF